MFEDYFSFQSIFVLGASVIYVFWQLRSRPDGVERVVLFGLIWGCGPRVFSYSLLDEIVISLITAYILIFRREKLRAFAGALRRNKIYWMPSILCLFLALHSLFSLVVLKDPRMVKWLVVFVSAPFVIWVIPRWLSGQNNSDKSPVGFVMSHLYIYFVAYILQGLAGEIYFGEWGRFQTQDLYWQGSSLAVMPAMLFFAACYFLPKQFMHEWKKTLYLGVLLAFCAFFYDSRILQLLLVCCPVAGLIIYAKGYRHWIAIFGSFVAAFVGNVYFDNYDISPHYYVKSLKKRMGYDEAIYASFRYCIEYVGTVRNVPYWQCEPKPTPSTTNTLGITNKLNVVHREKQIKKADVTFLGTIITNPVFGEAKKSNYEALEFGVSSLSNSVNIINPLENDFDRSLQLMAGIEATLGSPRKLVSIFGTGFYTHRYTIGPLIIEKYEKGLPGYPNQVTQKDHTEEATPIFRTTAMTGYIVDTGLTGICLFCMAVFSTAYFALRIGLRPFIAGGCCAFISFAWTYSNYSFENALWFLLMFIVVGFSEEMGVKQRKLP